MKKHKFAIIGFGFIAPKHVEAIKSVGGEIAAVCDIDSSKWPDPSVAPSFYKSYEHMIKEVDFDYLSICAPNYLHTEMILEAAKHGKTILCEKPMTFNIKEVGLLKGVPKLYGMFQLRYLPEIGEMRKASREAVGVNMVVEMKRSRTYHNSWKGDPTKTGGLLMNIGCHYFDLVGHLFGYDGFLSDAKIEETNAKGVLHYDNRINVHWQISFTEEQPSYERSITFTYADGSEKKFDLVQKENLHIRAYEDLMWCHGVTAKEEEKIIKMIDQICRT